MRYPGVNSEFSCFSGGFRGTSCQDRNQHLPKLRHHRQKTIIFFQARNEGKTPGQNTSHDTSPSTTNTMDLFAIFAATNLLSYAWAWQWANTSGVGDPDLKRVDTPHRRCLCRVYVSRDKRRASEFLSGDLRAIGDKLTAGWQLAGRVSCKVSVWTIVSGMGRLN